MVVHGRGGRVTCGAQFGEVFALLGFPADARVLLVNLCRGMVALGTFRRVGAALVPGGEPHQVLLAARAQEPHAVEHRVCGYCRGSRSSPLITS
ncbi:hypothetical protein ACFXKJ_41870, partial [Kitasatospora indigofera]|uniref:hypothetical protein n=1 Tax=Kitasatospora indigofera TaxID=67307 RepID=UPI00368504ED